MNRAEYKMKYYSTNNKNNLVSFRDAVIKGIADDGGLFLPLEIPVLPKSFLESLSTQTFQEIAFSVAAQFIDDIPKNELQTIIKKTITFDAPLVRLSEDISILELFHGPTLAFKDFGARFLANTLRHFIKDKNKETVILVATSGDTGSAVANAFLGMEGIRVGLLYPSGKVSTIQEQQLTTIGGNVQAFEIQGTFDDCQTLVKKAFLDDDLKSVFNLTPANSINIARLLPQSFYYFWALAQRGVSNRPVVFTVPSGNFGNLTAGIIAFKMGLDVAGFIAAVNANVSFPKYLTTGKYAPAAAIQTLSNAMDVGDPSNFTRIQSIFGEDMKKIKETISSVSISDTQTIEGIQKVYKKYGYVIDPHGAVGYQAFRSLRDKLNAHHIVLETAHPAKFSDTVEEALKIKVDIPNRLAACLEKEKQAVRLGADFNRFKTTFIELFLD